MTDSITAKENTTNKIWASRVYQGSMVTIQLKIPINEKGESILKIDKVNFGYGKFGGEYFGSPGASGACNINVLCPQGNGWQNERNSVALIVVNGNAACTGVLVMNTCGTNIPYFLTANHCVDEGGPVTNWVFQFQYWSATCTPNSGWHEDIQFNGSTLKAKNAETDFALLQLNQPPPANSGIQYAGWNRTTNIGNVTTCLHHPRGDLMKVSNDNIFIPTAVSWMGSPTLSHWRVIFNQGIVQNGSSGAPLFDQNHRIIGQLHGNQNNVCSQTDNNCFCNTIVQPFGVVDGAIGEFGRFDLSWTGGGTNTTRLSNWLDPSNSGAMTTNTTNVSNLIDANPVITITGSPYDIYFCTGSSTYSLSGLPSNASVVWSVNKPNITSIPVPSNSPSVVLTKQGIGDVTLTATVTLCDQAVKTINKIIIVGAPQYTYEIVPSPISSYTECYKLNKTYSFTLQPTGTDPYFQSNGTYQWFLTGTGVLPSTSKTVSFQFTQVGDFTLTARPNNTCGLGPVSTYPEILHAALSCTGGHFTITTTPNPVANNLVVTIENESKELNTEENIKMILNDFYTKQSVKQWQFKNDHNQFNINVSGLKKGPYILLVTKGKSKEAKQIIIE